MRSPHLNSLPLAALFGIVVLASACGDDSHPASDINMANAMALECPVVVSDANCDKTTRPIVFIHGTLGAGDNAEHVAMLFGSNGFCQDRFVAIDYNSLGDDPSAKVDALITQVLAATGQTKVDLMGHSQGGMWGAKYVADATRAAKVANYIHLAGGDQPANTNGVNVMSIVSKQDLIAGLGVVEGSKVVTLETEDHMGVAESTESFVAMYNFLLGKAPQYMDVQCGDELVTLAGKVASLGDNVPAAGSTVEFYELTGAEPEKRGMPSYSVVVGADGSIGPTQVKRGVAYESRVVAPDGSVTGHMYNSPWKRSDLLVRGLVPAKSGLSAAITNQIPKSDDSSVIVVRYSQRAIRSDLGDTLTFDGQNVLVAADTTPAACTVAYFTWDQNGDGATDLTDVAALAIIPFVKAVDVFTPAKKPKWVNVTFNGSTIQVPNWPSASQGPTVVMFQ